MAFPESVLILSLLAMSVQPALAAKKELAAAANAAAGAATSVGITAAQQAQLKGEATQALSTLSNSVKAMQPGLQNGLTPDQVGKISAQSQQALTGLMSNPEAMAAAAKSGVTLQTLNQVHSQTDAALKGMKNGDSKALDAELQKGKDFMNSEQGAKLKGEAGQAASAIASDPQLRRQAAQAGEQAKKAALETYTDLKAKGFTQDKIAEKMGLTPEQATALKAQASQGAASAASVKEKAKAALVKFCKKYEGQENVPARCRKAKTAPIQ